MARSSDKFKDKAKTPTMVIDGVKGIVPDSAESEAFSWKWRFYRFLEELANNPDLKNPLDTWDWDYMTQPDENYDLDDCVALLKKNKKTQSILKKWNMLGMPHDWYKIQSEEYLMSGLPPYKSKLHYVGWLNRETGEFADNTYKLKA